MTEWIKLTEETLPPIDAIIVIYSPAWGNTKPIIRSWNPNDHMIYSGRVEYFYILIPARPQGDNDDDTNSNS